MREYWIWQKKGGPMVRVHRRVFAGLEREAGDGFRGILLGTTLPGGEIIVEDFAQIPPGAEFDSETGSIAGQKAHSLPPVGYARVSAAEDLHITEEDRELFEKQFPGPRHVLVFFERLDQKLRWADAYVTPETVLREQAPPEPEPGWAHRVLFRERAAASPAGESAERHFSWRLPPSAILPVAAGFLIGVGAYLALRGEAPRAAPPVAPTPIASKRAAPAETTKPQAPPVAEKPAPFEADRSIDPGKGTSSTNRANARQQIRSVLERWRDSLLENDVDGYANLYAPSVGPYFKKARVSRAEIADEVRRTIARYGPLAFYKISDVSIVPTDDRHATATLRKKWRTVKNNFSGEEKAQLKLERQNGNANWVITSEKELKVYWVRKS